MFSRLLGKKKKKQSLQDLTTFLNPGKQRLRELKSIRKAALQRTLTNLQDNIKRRSQKLQPISEKYIVGNEKEDVHKSPKKLASIEQKVEDEAATEEKTDKEHLEEKKEKEEKEQNDSDDKEAKKVDDGNEKEVEVENAEKKKEDEVEKKKPTSILDEPPKTRRKTDKEKRLEREAQEKADKEAKKREELERLRAKWPIMKNVSKKQGSAPSGRLDNERWHTFLEEQFKVLKSTPNVSITYINATLWSCTLLT